MHSFSDAIAGIAAAVLGWVFVSLPKIVRRQTTWVFVLANVGIAAISGLVTWSLISYAWPDLPKNLSGSICAVVGGQCDYWYSRYADTLRRTADRAEKNALGAPSDTPRADEHPSA